MFKVTLTESDLQSLTRFCRIAMIGKYRDRRQWISRTAYKSCLKEIRQAKEGKDGRPNFHIAPN